MQQQTAPAMGERRAISGYKAQYEIEAVKIHHAIKQKTLQFIRIADPNAGRVDDFQLQTSSQIDAFQIKWSTYPGLLTFNYLVTSQKNGSPCLINQLSDGWKKLKARYPDKKIIVHLVTRDRPSPKGKIIEKIDSSETNHFAGFIAHIWKNVHDSTFKTKSDIPPNWKPVWEKLQRASELTDDEFFEFVRNCELDFGYKIPEFEEYNDLERQAIKNEISQILHFLFLSVADPMMIVELSVGELLRKLGWAERYDLINAQNFRVDDAQYRPIEGLDNNLEFLISKTTKGYIAVIGTPGSGKSTFLTQVLKNREERVIKYYSFIPDSIEPINLRGESKNFLHDITLQLEKEGFSPGGSISSLDREVLLRRFFDQMRILNEDWKKTGRKTLFLVDGLDHITREQRPVHSLLIDLPIPESIPDGIIFILGSQTETIFSSRIRADIRNRKIEMKPLSHQATYEIITNSHLRYSPNEDQITKIFSLSSGHPLALKYILNKITEVKSTAEIALVLDDTKAYEGNIELQYQSYFDDIYDDSKLFELLGLISRCKGDIDLQWVETWYDGLSIVNLRNKFSHYFKKEDNNTWSFFHNSFKRFVFERTSESDPGNVNPSMSIKFYKKLAEKSSDSPCNSIHSWDEVFYRSRAQQYQKIIEIATRIRFEEQMRSFRPIYEIREDIDLALNAAREQKDIVAFIRFIFLGSEFEQRDGYIKEVLYFRLLYSLLEADERIPLKHILSGNQLKIKNEIALKLSRELKIKGRSAQAKKIFELSEPIEILNAAEPIENPQKYENPSILIEWARSASYFRDLDRTVELIKKCQQKANFTDRDYDSSVKSLQKSLLHALGISLVKQKRWDDVLRIQTELNNHFFADSLKFSLVWNSWEICFRDDDFDRAKEFLEWGKADIGFDYLYPNSDTFNPGKITRVALGICEIDKDLKTARKFLKNVPLPEINNSIFSTKAGLSPFLDLIYYLRVNFYLNEQYSPEKILQLVGDEKSEISDEFKRHLYAITYISTMGDKEKFLPASRITELVSPILKFFYKSYFPRFQDQDSGFVIAYSKLEFYDFLVNAVSKHGPEAIHSLCRLLDEEWDNLENEKYWPSDIWRKVINVLNYRHAEKEWCENKLLLLQMALLKRPNEYADTYARVHEFLNQATSWNNLKKFDLSKECLSKMFQTSLSIGFHKDYQLNSWIEWLDTINNLETDKRIERTLEFVNYIQVLHGYVEERADEYAAEELIKITFNWSPRHSLILTNWFLEKDIISQRRARYNYLLQILKSQEDIPLESVNPYVDSFLFCQDEIEGVYREIIEVIITRAFQQDVKLGRKITRHFIHSIEMSIFEKNKPQWKLIIADQLKNLGINPQFSKLSIKNLETEIKSTNTNSVQIDDSIPKKLLKYPITPELLIAKIPELKYRRKWEPIILKHLNSFTKKDINKILSTTENPDLTVLLAQRLFELNDLKNAQNACLKTIRNCPFGGYGLPLDYGAKVNSMKIISKIDAEKAKEIFYETVYSDLTSNYPYYLMVAMRINEVISQLFEKNQIIGIWIEIQEYLNSLFSEYSMPNEIPAHFYDRIKDNSAVVAFDQFQKNF
ncbi:MAG: ATP-binding protein [Methanoregula sp.]